MPGPTPDPNARRRGRRDSSFGVLPAEGRQEPVPPLPAKPDPSQPRLRWLQETRDAWGRWWRSPQATMWSDASFSTICRMARLHDAAVRRPTDEKLARELRMLEDRFGLTPKGMLANRWRVAAPVSGRTRSSAHGVRHLRAVGGDLDTDP